MRILGVNGGNGVILHPLKKYVVGNFEPRAIFHSMFSKQWHSNFQVPIFKNWDLCKKLVKEADIIMGAPDCGHSSILSYSRKKSLGKPKENQSLTYFIESIHHYKPKIFLMENLPALLKTYGLEDLMESFKGYHIKILQGTMDEWGNSQINRERILIIGCLDEAHLKRFKKPKLKDQIKTCKQLLKGLKKTDLDLGHVREKLKYSFTMYSGFRMTGEEAQLKWLNELKGKKRWPVHDRKFSTAPGVYRNLDNDYPATARKANRQFNTEGLMMSPRELARIQGIPDDFKIFIESETYKEFIYWINKGRASVTKCPPYEIGQWFLKSLNKIIYETNL